MFRIFGKRYLPPLGWRDGLAPQRRFFHAPMPLLRRALPKLWSTPAVCLSKDGTCFLAYHPELETPYEHTLPLPEELPEPVSAEDEASPLKVQLNKAHREKIANKTLTLVELEEMFGECRNFFREQPAERSRKELAEHRHKLKRKTLNELPDDL